MKYSRKTDSVLKHFLWGR